MELKTQARTKHVNECASTHFTSDQEPKTIQITETGLISGYGCDTSAAKKETKWFRLRQSRMTYIYMGLKRTCFDAFCLGFDVFSSVFLSV